MSKPTNTTERDELALELFIGDNYKQSREASIADWQHFHNMNKYYRGTESYKAMAQHAIDMGWRKDSRND